MRIVFFGTPPLAANILEDLLLFPEIQVVAVVTRCDKPKGRHGTPQPSAAKEKITAVAPHIPLHQPIKASTEEFAEILSAYQADFFVVVAYGEIISQRLLDLPRNYCINVHGSLLPHYRGAAPMQRALMDGLTQTGVTIMQMVKGLDAGDMIVTKIIPTPLEVNLGMLEEAMWKTGTLALKEFFTLFAAQKAILTPQDHSQATYAAKLTTADYLIDWSAPILKTHNQIRALAPRPGARTMILFRGEKRMLKLLRTTFISSDLLPDDVLAHHATSDFYYSPRNELFFYKDGSFLRIDRVQLEGRNPITGFQLWQSGPFEWDLSISSPSL